MRPAVVSGAFDNLGSREIRFLEEAARLGPLAVVLWPDAAIERLSGVRPRFGFEERRYCLASSRFVDSVVEAPAGLDPDRLPDGVIAAERPVWVVEELHRSPLEGPRDGKRAFCAENGLGFLPLGPERLTGFPVAEAAASIPPHGAAKRVVVTGCFDWLHSGHLRFFEEAAAYGELNVVIGSDANVRLLKGEGHPLFPEEERRYVASSIRSVARCLVSTGSGWLDAEPEIRALGADRYVVNEDGDKPEKRRFCAENGIEYVVLARTPKEGLPRRSSTDLRGF